MNNLSYDKKCELLIIGDSTVGKTSVLLSYIGNAPSSVQSATVGIDYFSKDEIINNNTIRCKFWDTAGQERYKSLTNNFFKNSHGIILVFDLNSRDSFDNLKFWVQSINLNLGLDNKVVKKLLIGNKLDLERIIELEEAKEFADINNMDYFETSAKENINVTEAFFSLIAKIEKSGVLKPAQKKFIKTIKLNDDSNGNKGENSKNRKSSCKC